MNLLISPPFLTGPVAKVPFLRGFKGRGKTVSKVAYSGIVNTFIAATIGSIDY